MGFFDLFRRNRKPMQTYSSAAYPQGRSIKKLWDSGSEREWKAALEYYYELMRPEQKVREEYITKIGAEGLKKLDERAFYNFLYDTYFVWKYTAKNRLATTRKNLEKYILNDELFTLKDIQTRLFSTPPNETGKCLRIACEIRGLGTAGASGLLALLFPKDFGTVDQFVVKRLQEIDHPGYGMELKSMIPEILKIKDAIILNRIMKEKAAELNQRFKTDFWTPRRLDMVLWAFGR